MRHTCTAVHEFCASKKVSVNLVLSVCWKIHQTPVAIVPCTSALFSTLCVTNLQIDYHCCHCPSSRSIIQVSCQYMTLCTVTIFQILSCYYHVYSCGYYYHIQSSLCLQFLKAVIKAKANHGLSSSAVSSLK